MKRVRLTKKGKSFFSDVLFVSVALLWVVSPFMQLLGFPIFVIVYVIWVQNSETFEKICKWLSRRLFNE